MCVCMCVFSHSHVNVGVICVAIFVTLRKYLYWCVVICAGVCGCTCD